MTWSLIFSRKAGLSLGSAGSASTAAAQYLTAPAPLRTSQKTFSVTRPHSPQRAQLVWTL